MSQSSFTNQNLGRLTVGEFITLPTSSVTQSTSITTSVNLETQCGKINTFSATTATNSTSVFTANHSEVNANSIVLANIIGYSGAGIPSVHVTNITQGSFSVVLKNNSDASALNSSVKIGYLTL